MFDFFCSRQVICSYNMTLGITTCISTAEISATPCLKRPLLTLKWSIEDIPPTTIFQVCNDRVVQRGENHQTLRAKTDDKMHEEVIWRFIKSTEALTEGEVDACIDMDINDTLEEAVKRAVEGCVEEFGLPYSLKLT